MGLAESPAGDSASGNACGTGRPYNLQGFGGAQEE